MNLQFSTPFDPGRDEDAPNFPPAPAVFALFAEPEAAAGARPYLSYARDLRRRLARLLRPARSNSRRLNLRAFTRRIEFQPVASNFEAQWTLYLLNRFYYPRQLRRRLRLRFPALVKINLSNRFPRCYPTQRLSGDGSLYYGPFPSVTAAERFTADFLDIYKIRRCVPDLRPDPSHPGCIYSQMKMCLAPCFMGCTDQEYDEELKRVVAFLDSGGDTLVRELETKRDQASSQLAFEQAARAHRLLEKAREVIRQRPALVREISSLHAILVLPGPIEKSVTFFRVTAGRIQGPALLRFEENVASPIPLDQQIHQLLSPLGGGAQATGHQLRARALPPWEHLSLLARWYYSSFRTDEIVMLAAGQEIPHARLIRLCRKVMGSTRSPASKDTE